MAESLSWFTAFKLAIFVALLGAPGSGKTTVVNLIPRFYDVTSGSVTIDGTGVRDMTLSSLRRNIGLACGAARPIRGQGSGRSRRPPP